MNTVQITLNGKEIKIMSGLTAVDDLYVKAQIQPDENCLYLDKDGDIDIPLLPGDYIIFHGEECVFSDKKNLGIEPNPDVRKPACPMVNGNKITLSTSSAKLPGSALCAYDTELSDVRLFADLSGQADAFISRDWMLIIQDADCYITIPAGDDQNAIDLEQCAKHGRKPPKGQEKYKIKVDAEKYIVQAPEISGQEILALASKDFNEWTLNQKFRGGRRTAIRKDQLVDLTQPGVERFETALKQAQQG